MMDLVRCYPLSLVFLFFLSVVLLVGGGGITGGAPSFFVLAFFTFSLMAAMSSFPSVGAEHKHSGG